MQPASTSALLGHDQVGAGLQGPVLCVAAAVGRSAVRPHVRTVVTTVQPCAADPSFDATRCLRWLS
jgi:hypothetical protein